MFKEAVGDLGDAAAADGGNAGDRQKIRHQMMRGFAVGAGKGREYALIFRPAVGGGERQLIEVMFERGFAVEILDQAPLPRRRQIERCDEGGEQTDIAYTDVWCARAVLRGRFQPERQHFGVGRRFVLPPETLDAGLQKFGRGAFAVTKYRAEIAKACRRPRRRRGQIIARHRNGQIGPQAQFAAVRIGGEKHAPADVLAGQIEERLGRLQHRRRDLGVTGAHIGRDERLRPRVRTVLCQVRRDVRHGNDSLPRPFSTGRVAIR